MLRSQSAGSWRRTYKDLSGPKNSTMTVPFAADLTAFFCHPQKRCLTRKTIRKGEPVGCEAKLCRHGAAVHVG